MVVAVAVGAPLGGCGEEPRPKELQKPLVVREQSSSVTQGTGGYVVTWAGVIANPNRWHFGENVAATVIGRDIAGKEVVHTEQPLDAVPPAGSLRFTGQALASSKPIDVRVTFRPAQWRKAARIPSAFVPFPISAANTEKLGNGSYLVTGAVGNPYQKAATSLVVTALLRDKAGKLVGGASTYVDDVRTGAPRRFVLTVEGLAGTGQVARTDITARTWGSSARPYEELALSGAAPPGMTKPKTPPFARDRGSQAMPTERRP
ncbi:FxLYD domain-containing protein [Sphaerisporangium sp. TRM90804]|uniref:FxLYD domain-containing protein n=1 Tax=Sphaerisporangium sp. TRM90804 TaxID=3031113 RepID=UPI0024473F88|nr:FxLYD domain-containing protein [Sphaerisporangium sp. TRM90804]MDH2425848.1 FxLYD domain-containing protein [Sphaerisporangium sp. TRM90804]